MFDKEIESLIQEELTRQENCLELIASENIVSEDILEATGSILTNKYAEGYPTRRFYNGCHNVDKIEQLAIDRCKALFGCEHANVQPHSGSQANMGVYMACLKPGDTILAQSLDAGGHLTHGSPVNFSGKLYNIVPYGVTSEGYLDYEEIRNLAKAQNPKLIVCGASNYSRAIDFSKFKEIADEVGALLLADISHIAGLVATGYHMSPIPFADFVTTTTHKSLRGPRGAVIMCKQEWAKKIDSAVFPGMQGGPLEHVIAAKAICFKEALLPKFRNYIMQVLINTSSCSMRLKDLGAECSATDNHLFLLNVKKSYNMTGLEAQKALEEIGITTNKNMIPNDTETPNTTSGLRIGFAAITTRGCTSQMAINIATLIHNYLSHNITTEEARKEVKKIVKHLKKVR